MVYKKNKGNKKNYTESHKGRNHGSEYDYYLYSKNTFDSKIWEVEKNILSNFFLKMDKSKNVLDFACGTGRVTKFIEDFEFKNIYGFDVSDTMLEIASKKLDRTKLINIDINKENTVRYKNQFGLVTAFRFFLNAEDELKDITFKNIYELIVKNGYFIFNIHGNKNSIRFFYVFLYNIKQKIRYFVFKKEEHIFTYKKQLSISEIKKYLVKYKFEVIGIISYSFLPKIFNFLLTKKFFVFLETKLSSKKFYFGTRLIFLAKKL